MHILKCNNHNQHCHRFCPQSWCFVKSSYCEYNLLMYVYCYITVVPQHKLYCAKWQIFLSSFLSTLTVECHLFGSSCVMQQLLFKLRPSITGILQLIFDYRALHMQPYYTLGTADSMIQMFCFNCFSWCNIGDAVAGGLSKDIGRKERRAEFFHVRNDKILHEESCCCQLTSNSSGIIEVYLAFIHCCPKKLHNFLFYCGFYKRWPMAIIVGE